MYDSTADTLEHQDKVVLYVDEITDLLLNQAAGHDTSKLEEPEKIVFDEYTPKLRDSTYGSDEYHVFLAEMGPALKHHYEENRHHPEHFEDGIAGMTLIDLIEMLCDWKAATERHANGDLGRSLNINRERFMISNQLDQILRNTAERMGWL